MNPEFRRNLWLQWSPQRAVLMPAVLLLIAMGVYSSSSASELWRDLGNIFGVLMGALAAAWGSVLTVSSINQEVAERTWDQQRLSSLTPWQMTWGKLLGAVSYAWYGALLCAAVVAASALRQGQWGLVLPLLAAGMAAALALHAWVMATCLHVRDPRQVQPLHSALSGLLLLLVLMGMQAVIGLWGLLDTGADDPQGGWWQLGWAPQWQALALALAMLALGLLAAWRCMGEQLMVRTLPWAWPLGCAALGGVLAGFLPPEWPLAWRLLTAIFWVALAATGVNLLTVADSRLRWQTLGYHARQRQWRRWAQALPLWPLSWGLAALCLLPLLLSAPSHSAMAPAQLMAPMLLYMLRNAGIVLFFAWGASRRSPVAMALLSCLVLDLLLPVMLLGAQAGADTALLPWLWPLWGAVSAHADDLAHTSPWRGMALHLLAVGMVLLWRWHRVPGAAQADQAG
ncbi:MAG: hypothetical protein Q4F13_07610 [Pseudomonadota bacterium]|nr:hypothetical protein [Pseudomonadota bacterium]